MSTKKKPTKKPAARKSAAAREEILVSLAEDMAHLEEIGARIVSDRLLTAARDRLAYAEEDEGVLGKMGFDAAWRRELEKELEALEKRSHERQDAGSAGRTTGHELDVAFARADEWLKTYNAVVKNSGPAIRQSAPKLSHHDHSPSVIASEVRKLATFIRKNARATERHGGGVAFADEGDAIAKAVTDQRATHKKARTQVPEAARSLDELDGIVYLELVRLSRAAHAKLSPERARKYALDEARPRRGSGGSKGGAAPSSPPPGTPSAS